MGIYGHFRVTVKSPTDQRCRMQAGTTGILACTAASHYPRTLPSLSLALRRSLCLLLLSEEVLVRTGANLALH